MPQEFEDAPATNINLRQYVAIARRRRWYFLLPLFTGWLVVWGISWILPSVYRSGTLILVEQPSVPSQYVTPNIAASNLQDRLTSITQQILSRTRLMRIIETQHLYSGGRRRSTQDEVIERMRKDIEIQLVHDRDQLTAFNVYYSASDPQVAQNVTRELTNLFITENLEARQEQSESTTQFLEAHLAEARTSLSEQEEKIREFKDQHLGDLPGQLQSNLQILGSLQAQLGGEQDGLNRAKQQGVYLESLLGQYRSVSKSATPGDDVPLGLANLNRELNSLKSHLAELRSHYTDLHPDVRKVKEQIATAEAMKQRATEDLRAGAPPTTTDGNDPADSRSEADVKEMAPVAELKSQLKVNGLEIANRERTLETLNRKIAEYQSRLDREPVREQQLADLTRNYDQSRANYESLLKKRNDSQLATSLEREQQGEHFRILDPPSLPVKPHSPDRLKLSLAGLLVGAVLGGIVTAAAEMTDDRIYDGEELKSLIPVEVLAEVPAVPTTQEERQQRKSFWLGWAATGFEVVLIVTGCAISYFHG